MSRSVRRLALLLGLLLPAPALLADVHVTTHLDRPQQTVEGWGASLAHWNANARALYATDAFRAAYRDLGLNILRVDMQKEVLVASGSDFATPVPLGESLADNINLMNFGRDGVATFGSLAQWLSANALEPDRVRLTGALWTPPHWMKGPTGKSSGYVGYEGSFPTPFLSGEHAPWNPSPVMNGDSVGGRLKTEDPQTLQQYGRYIASWVKGFEQTYGVPFHAISLQNESTYENPFNSMTFAVDEGGNQDFTQYAKGLKAVKDAWQQFGLDTKVMGPHVANFAQNPGNPYNLWRQDMMIQGVKDHADPQLIDFLDYYNANFYNGTDSGAVKNIAAFYRGGSAVAPGEWAHWHTPPGVADDGKGIWFSEAGGESADWPGALRVALKIHNALVHGQASAYVYWQLADGGNSVTEHTLLGTTNVNDPESSKKYAAFKQFSRYIRPGAVRLDAAFDNGESSTGGSDVYDTDDSLNVSAFYHEEDGRLTFILVNLLDDAEPVTLTLPEGLTYEAMHAFRTSETENFASLGDLAAVNGQLVYTAPAMSVTTITAIVPDPAAGALLLPTTLLVAKRRSH